jgi:hypothetical protein
VLNEAAISDNLQPGRGTLPSTGMRMDAMMLGCSRTCQGEEVSSWGAIAAAVLVVREEEEGQKFKFVSLSGFLM